MIDTDGKIVSNVYTETEAGTTVGGAAVKLGPAAAGAAFITFGGGTWQKTTTISSVPEPGTWLMMMVGLGLIGRAARRRHKGMLRTSGSSIL